MPGKWFFVFPGTLLGSVSHTSKTNMGLLGWRGGGGGVGMVADFELCLLFLAPRGRLNFFALNSHFHSACFNSPWLFAFPTLFSLGIYPINVFNFLDYLSNAYKL